MSRRLLIGGGVLFMFIAGALAQGTVYTYDHPTSSRKSSIWIPDGVTTIRGILLNGNGANTDSTGEVNHLHKRAFCEQFDFALMATGYYHGFWETNGHLDMEAMTNAIQAAASASGHAELVNAPFVTYGFSNGGQMAYGLMHWLPDRVIAFCANKGVAYRYDGENPPLTVPGILIAGANDSAARRTSISNVYTIGRSEGAPWAWLEEHNVAHERGNAEALLFAFYAEVIEQRYPTNLYPTAVSQPTLLSIVETNGWLVSASPDNWATGVCEIQPSAGYVGDKNAHGWVPSESIAHLFRAVASYDTTVSTGFNPVQKPILTRFPIDPIESWGGRGRLYYPGRTIHYEIDIAPSITDWTKVEFFDGATKLGEALNEGSNTIIADLLLDDEQSNNSIHAVLTLSNAAQRTSSVNMMQSDTLRTPDVPTNLDSNNADEGVPSASANHTFSWGLPANVASVTGYSWAMNGGADEESQGTTASVTYENLPNGEYVFRVRARANGVWGPSASFTLLVDATPTIEVSDTALDMVAVTSATFNVWMSGPSDAGTTVTVARTSGDVEFEVQSGATLVFTPANWTTPQTVTIVKNEPYDPDEGGAVFTLTAPGSESVEIMVTGYDPPSSLLYYDGFDYSAGINLNGANGGSGWGGSWDKGGTGGASGDIQEDGLAYSQGAISLAVEGRSFRNANAGVHNRRELSQSYSSSDNTTLWFSFLAYGISGSRVVIDFATDNNAYNRLGVGMLPPPASPNWQVGNQLYSAGTDTGIAFSTNAASPDLILGRIQLNAVGDDVLDVWINPSLSAPPAGAAHAQRTGNWTFDRFRLIGASANQVGLDEIRIGETWSSVVGSSGGGGEPPAPGGPTIDAQPASVTINEGESATLSVAATSSEGSLTYQWHQGESGLLDPIENATNSTFNTPVFNFAGSYSYWVSVSDDNGTTNSTTATITVQEEGGGEPEPEPGESFSVLLDVGSTDTTNPDSNGNYWNSWAGNVSVAGLVDSTGDATGIGLLVGDTLTVVNQWSGYAADIELSAPWNIATVHRDAAYTSSSVGHSFTLTNLNMTALYSFEFFGARSATDARWTRYTVAGASTNTVTLQTSGTDLGGSGVNYNNSMIATIESVLPSADGEIIVNFGVHSGGWAYLNMLRITVESSSSAPAGPAITSQPASISINEGQSTTLSVAATASEGELAYQWYEGVSGVMDTQIANATNANYTTPVFNTPGTYNYWVLVSDDIDSVASDTATVTVLELDLVPPDAIDDLTVTGQTANSVSLAWTAPADEGSGTAGYLIRYNTTGIANDTDFNGATAVANPPVPATPGQTQTFTVTGLSSDTTYYFAIKTADQAANVSELSNVASATTDESFDPLTILWFGNSLSPDTLRNTINAAAQAADYPQHTYHVQQIMGSDIQGHLDRIASNGVNNIIDSLPAGSWDVVIIQGASLESSTMGGDTRGTFITNSIALYDLVHDHSPGVRLIMYETWARPPHHYKLDSFPYVGGLTPEQAQEEIRQTHEAVAEYVQTEHGAVGDVSYVGTAMQNFNHWEPSLFLESDGYHLSQNLGRIFTGMVLFNTIYGGAVEPLSPASASVDALLNNLNQSAEEWIWLAQYADDPFFDRLRIDEHPQSGFVVQHTTAELTVAASTQNGDLTYQWYAGESGDVSQPIANATNATYTTPVMAVLGEYDYWVEVADDNDTRNSFTATLTVRVLDVTPPEVIDDLIVTGQAGTRISLAWTAPADDVPDGWGTASYDIRYSTSPITIASFDAALPVAAPPLPAAAGTPQTFDVLGLSTETTYYFAIKTIDEADNVSDISNVASGTTLAPAPSVLIDDFDSYTATNLPHSTGAINSTLAGWRSAPSTAASGYAKIIETGGNDDGHLRGHRTFRATARQGIGIWIDRTDYPQLMPGETYYLQFDYRVGREGDLDYRTDAWVSYSVGARTNATYVEARAIDGGSGPNFSNASAIWTAAYFQAGPVVTNETAWSTYTSGVGFSFPENTDLLFIAFAAQGFGIQSSTSDWDTLDEYTYLDIDNVWFISGEPPVPGPTITAQPVDVTINVGETAMLSVTATTATESMGYQWYQGDSGDTSSPIGGAVLASYTTPTMNQVGAFNYWVRVFDDDGAVDSDTAIVTVLEPDTDEDGIPDWWEELHFGGITAADATALAANGVNTILQAFIADLDPNDPESFFVIEDHSSAAMGYVLTWTVAPGRRYAVYGTTDLAEGFGEEPLVDGLAAGEFVDEINAGEPRMFYLIEVSLE